jgi:DNA-binding response OmpR family regulator
MHDDEVGIYITKNGYIHLTATENIILKKLIENKGKVAVKLENKYKFKKGFGNSTRLTISRLRKKLKGEIEIKNKRSRGYYID